MKIYIWNEYEDTLPKGWNAVEGKKVTIPGYKEYDFYLTDAIEEWNEGLINVTEGKTGCKVGSGGVNTRRAITSAKIALEKRTKSEINQAIQNRIERNGISPLYHQQTTPKRQERL